MSQEQTAGRTSKHELPILECRACGAVQDAWQNRYCIRCWSRQLSERSASRSARLRTWATFAMDFGLDGFAPPYTVAWVELDEGPRVSCVLSGDVESAQFDQQVELHAVDEVAPSAQTAGQPAGGLRGYVPRDRWERLA